MWIRGTKYVFKNPDQITKKMVGSTHPFFQDFIKKLMQDFYIEGLCRSLKALKIGATTSKPAKSKHKLMGLLNSESDSGESNDVAIAGCCKYVKKSLYRDSDLEDVSSALRHSSIFDEAYEPPEVKETWCKVKNKKKKKRKRNHKNISSLMAIIDFFISCLFFFFFFFKKLSSNMFKKLGTIVDYRQI